LKETYFFIQTGIRTDHSSIPMHIELKEKLGESGWDSIRLAKPFLKAVDGSLEVKMKKWVKVANDIWLIVALCSISVEF